VEVSFTFALLPVMCFARVLRKGWQGGTLVPDSSSYVGMIRVKFAGSVSPSQPRCHYRQGCTPERLEFYAE